MNEAMSSHDLRGLSLISDLCMLEGVLLIIPGVFLLVLGSLYTIIPILVGAFMIVVGYYLDNLRKFAWWAVIIVNSLLLANVLLGVIYTGIIIGEPLGLTNYVTFIINVVLGSVVIGYLIKRNVRNLFFEETFS
ncbi:MAG: hypothetical protein ACFFCX_06880 [Candidatus Sifarchaeia archaeon]